MRASSDARSTQRTTPTAAPTQPATGGTPARPPQMFALPRSRRLSSESSRTYRSRLYCTVSWREIRRVSCQVKICLRSSSGAERAMRIVGHARRFREARVVVGHERGQERGSTDRVVEAAQAELLDEAVLQRPVGP